MYSIFFKYIGIWFYLVFVDYILGDYDILSKGYYRQTYLVVYERLFFIIAYCAFIIKVFYRFPKKSSIFFSFEFLVLNILGYLLIKKQIYNIQDIMKTITHKILPYHSDSIGWMIKLGFVICLCWLTMDIVYNIKFEKYRD